MTSENLLPPPTRLVLFDPQTLHRDCLCRLLTAAGFPVVGQYAEPRALLSALPSLRAGAALLCEDPREDPDFAIVEEAHLTAPALKLLVLVPTLDPELTDRCFRAGASGCLDRASSTFDAVVDGLQAVSRGRNVFPARAVEALLRAAGNRDADGRGDLLRSLSEREREVLSYIAMGAENLKIAALLNISERTVKAHVSSLYRKLGQDNRTQLALFARQSGIRAPFRSLAPS